MSRPKTEQFAARLLCEDVALLKAEAPHTGLLPSDIIRRLVHQALPTFLAALKKAHEVSCHALHDSALRPEGIENRSVMHDTTLRTERVEGSGQDRNVVHDMTLQNDLQEGSGPLDSFIPEEPPKFDPFERGAGLELTEEDVKYHLGGREPGPLKVLVPVEIEEEPPKGLDSAGVPEGLTLDDVLRNGPPKTLEEAKARFEHPVKTMERRASEELAEVEDRRGLASLEERPRANGGLANGHAGEMADEEWKELLENV